MNFKKLTTMPGFELLFAIGIAAIFVLPTAVLAQDTKNLEITIMNGDTVINGRNIKDLNGKEREDALNDINKIQAPHKRILRLERFNGAQGRRDILIQRDDHDFAMRDSADKPFRLRMRRDTTFAYNFKIERDGKPGDFNNDGEFRMRRPGPDVAFVRTLRRRNIQRFSFENTDKDGVNTNITYRVSDALPRWGFGHDEQPAKNAAVETKSDLALSNIRILPDFATGKTTLIFDLPSKTGAEATLTDSDGKVLFAEKALGGTFNKTFALPLNGHYYLTVKQGGKTAKKDILKEGE